MARLRSPSTYDDATVDAALEAMSATELRETIRTLLAWLDDDTYKRLTRDLVERATRHAANGAPRAPDEQDVDEIESFAAAAVRVGHADPSEVDEYLTDGNNAFVAREYSAACRVFSALLVPIIDGEIDLGQDEMIEEVLRADVALCAMQYRVARYMTAEPDARGEALLSAIDDTCAVHRTPSPIRELERTAAEPLPAFDDFLVQWRPLVERRVADVRNAGWGAREESHWLREVIARQEGASGLASVARASRQADDLRAWCQRLVSSRDWSAARAACEEAAALVLDDLNARGEFLDGVALATQELGGDDLDARLLSAWQAAPSLLRLRRWLGRAATVELLRERAATALGLCPPQASRQRALLHLLGGETGPAAALLAAAPGLGWSDDEHPGPLVFPIFLRILGEKRVSLENPNHLEELALTARKDEPHLPAASIEELLLRVGLPALASSARTTVIEAMRSAAERRIDGVTAQQMREQYEHAADLAMACARVDGAAGERWLGGLKDQYRRYPALQRAFSSSRG